MCALGLIVFILGVGKMGVAVLNKDLRIILNLA